MSARKAHNTGRNHIANVRDYFASLGHDKAQNIIDAIISNHEGGGRQQMMAAPSMRIGAGFMNPMPGPGGFQPPFPPQGYNGPPQGGPPPFRPPFQPGGYQGPPGGPPFPPMGGQMPPFPPAGQLPPFPPPGGAGMNAQAPRPPPSFVPQQGPPPQFTPQQGPPGGGAPGIHPDRLRMLGS